MTANILAVGDVVGNGGLRVFEEKIGSVKKLKNVAFTVVNGENAAGLGITPKQADGLLRAGADVITLGNHTWSRGEIADYLDDCPYIVRPLNFAPQVPGRGFLDVETEFGRVRVINLIGRCNMDYGPDNPFLAIEKALLKNDARVTLLDFHAEATSEKLAMGYHMDGRISAMWGTHTHVQTSDARVFPKGMGYVTDLGMTGPLESVIGVKPEHSLSMFLGNPRQRFDTAGGPCKIECSIFEIDLDTGRCVDVQSLRVVE